MSPHPPPRPTELLLLPDGRLLAHNLSPAMAAMLNKWCRHERAADGRAAMREIQRGHRNESRTLEPEL